MKKRRVQCRVLVLGRRRIEQLRAIERILRALADELRRLLGE